MSTLSQPIASGGIAAHKKHYRFNLPEPGFFLSCPTRCSIHVKRETCNVELNSTLVIMENFQFIESDLSTRKAWIAVMIVRSR